jgi:hypothetical protein
MAKCSSVTCRNVVEFGNTHCDDCISEGNNIDCPLCGGIREHLSHAVCLGCANLIRMQRKGLVRIH